jgi:hypothetical protein
MNMFEKLDIDKVKITPEMIAPAAAKPNKDIKETTTTNQEMLDSL